jgi:hypothetical protein
MDCRIDFELFSHGESRAPLGRTGEGTCRYAVCDYSPIAQIPGSTSLRARAGEQNSPRLQLFRRARQKELTPNQPNVRVKQTARITRPEPVLPASNFAYSRAKAKPPIPAKLRNTKPVTSSHRIPSTRAKEAAVTRNPRKPAAIQRLWPACCAAKRPAIRAAMPIFRTVETLITRCILTVSGYNRPLVEWHHETL